ncbi:FAD-dependent oxidoreductase [Corynebacterium auriscanis]|uniref:FAD-dependent oxidoreductase n=1 Tax=Corynebacterium auriscanis TaxID=99807 RepID=UPI003CF9093B
MNQQAANNEPVQTRPTGNQQPTHTQPTNPQHTTPQHTVIIGGVAGGMSTAARLRRMDENMQITVLESSGHVSFANCGLPYYLGQVIEDRDALLLQTPESLKTRFNIDVRVNSTAVAIDREAKTVRVQGPGDGEGQYPVDGAGQYPSTGTERGPGNGAEQNPSVSAGQYPGAGTERGPGNGAENGTENGAATNTEYTLTYDYLVLSPGASPFVPPIPGIERAYTLRTVEDTDTITTALAETQPSTAVIIGGGFIGLEVAENFAHRGINTTVIEANPQIMAPLDPEMASVVQQHLEGNNVHVLTDQQVNTITETHVCTAQGTELPADIVISAVGVRPNDQLARLAGLTVGERGGIVVDEQLRTSDPHIFALGDAALKKDTHTGADTMIPLAQTANRHGRLVADIITGRAGDGMATAPTKGTSVVQLFGLTATAVGWNEKRTVAELGGDGPFDVVHLHPLNHAGYYPGATALHMKLIYRTDDYRILGAQVIGENGADKRIDVIATAMHAGLKAWQLADLELAYSPQVGSAKDRVNLAGFIVDNRRNGQQSVQWHQVEQLQQDGWLVMDVRTAGEFAAGAIPGAVNIPVDELRDRIAEIPSGTKVIAQCQVGLRGNVATQLLRAHNVEVANLDGGYLTWSFGHATR